MNKIQDGFYAGGDSYKPLVISTDRRRYASVSFVGEQVIVKGLHGVQLSLASQSADTLIFTLEGVEAEVQGANAAVEA